MCCDLLALCRFPPSPPWGRGWTAAGVLFSRGGPGEGVATLLRSSEAHDPQVKASAVTTRRPALSPETCGQRCVVSGFTALTPSPPAPLPQGGEGRKYTLERPTTAPATHPYLSKIANHSAIFRREHLDREARRYSPHRSYQSWKQKRAQSIFLWSARSLQCSPRSRRTNGMLNSPWRLNLSSPRASSNQGRNSFRIQRLIGTENPRFWR